MLWSFKLSYFRLNYQLVCVCDITYYYVSNITYTTNGPCTLTFVALYRRFLFLIDEMKHDFTPMYMYTFRLRNFCRLS